MDHALKNLEKLRLRNVCKIIKNFQNYKGTGAKEIETLANYLIRFQDCVNYRKFQSLALPIGERRN